jgi:flagellum-specific ATP synthase
VGKSTLLGMIAKKSKEDINVIALIGERGREVREFIEKELGEEGMKRSIVVVSTSDETPLRQLRAADLATTIAEIFRDKGLNVLLMMDSITRFAIAKRTLDMANGDIPMMGGKTTSMESGLQKILERAGNNERGSITGIYTVLVENDDFNAPIPDMARGILDGHIVLTRRLADQNHFPAIDVLSSVSRVMQDITDQNHWTLSREIKKYLSIYMENEDEIKLGLIEKGVDREIDRSILIHKKIIHFLKQDINKAYTMEETLEDMKTTL